MYYFAPLVTALLFFTLGLFVFLKNKKSEINLIFFLLCLSTFGWQFSWFVLFGCHLENYTMEIIRIGYSFIIFIPITYFHFLSDFLAEKKEASLVKISYSLGIIFLIFLWTGTLFLNGYYQFFWGNYPRAGVLHPLYLVLLLVLTVQGSRILWNKLKTKTSALEHNQTKYVLIALLFYIPASLDFFINYGVQLYPPGFIFIAISLSIVAYAIVRHQLLDIEVIIKRAAVFAGIFAFIYGILAIVSILGKELLKNVFTWNEWYALVPVVFIISFFLRPLEKFLVETTDKYLFQRKYDYKHMIRQFMDELRSMTLNAQDIAKSTIDFLEVSVRPETSMVYMLNHFTNKYDLLVQPSSSVAAEHETLSSLFEDLKITGKIVNLKNAKNIPIADRVKLSSEKIDLLIPLMIRQELLGVLCLGPKKSGEDYEQDDLEVLADLSGALAIAMNNAQLFDERADAEKRAMIGTLATGINHEIGNPLSIIQVGLQSFLILKREGLLKDKSKEEILVEFSDIAVRCMDATKRISGIVKEIAEFAKPDKKLTFDRIDVEMVIGETIAVLKHEINLNQVKLEKRIRCQSPWVQADRGQIKQILFNLIRNAAQAMDKSDGKIIIDVSSKNGEICIQINDNGMGIPKKNLDKLFSPFFTTKEPGKGTGLGLSMVKLLVERNDGKIGVESEEGKGTVFTTTFKGGVQNEK